MSNVALTVIQGSASSSAALTPLQHLQAKFGVADLGGELLLIDLDQLDRILRGATTSELAFYSRADGSIKLARALEALPMKSDPKVEIKQFWIDPNTKTFDSVAFTPNHAPSTTINYWIQPTIKPAIGGSWQVICSFLRDVICAGDRRLHQ